MAEGWSEATASAISNSAMTYRSVPYIAMSYSSTSCSVMTNNASSVITSLLASQDVPLWAVHPEEYPYMTFVREHYISQKYLYRKFLRKEVGDERVSGTFTDGIFKGMDCGLVQKKSAGNHLTPWQARYLKFHSRNGEAVLAYYKDSSYVKPQGEIQLFDR